MNEQLAELSPWHRLCFAGLWCCADREGRLRDRPKRIKAEVFPYDDIDMNMLLWDLARTGFVHRYQIGPHPYIWIPTWADHQHPRPDEAISELPAYEPGSDRKGGPETSTFPAVRPIDTDPSLPSHATDATARMGSGDLEVGSGLLEMGNGNAAASPHYRAQDLLDLWNATVKPPLPRCRELNDERRSKIRLRLKKRPSLAEWRTAYEYINARPFYRGQNDRGWVADFDWTIKNDTTIAKVLDRVGSSERLEPPAYECTHVNPPCENPGNWKCRQRTALEGEKAASA